MNIDLLRELIKLLHLRASIVETEVSIHITKDVCCLVIPPHLNGNQKGISS